MGATSGREIDRYVSIERENVPQLLDQSKSTILNGNAEHAADHTGRYSTWLTQAENGAHRKAERRLDGMCNAHLHANRNRNTNSGSDRNADWKNRPVEEKAAPSPLASAEALEVEWLFRGNGPDRRTA